MAESAFYVLWTLAFSASQAIGWSWCQLKCLKENMSTIEAMLQEAKERQTDSEALKNKLTVLENVVRGLRVEIEREVQLWSRGSAGEKLRCFFSSSNPLVFCFRIGRRIKKLRESIGDLKPKYERTNDNVTYSFRAYGKIREWLRQLVAKIVKLNDDENLRDKIIVYIAVCIVGVCVDPFFLYIPFLSHTKMCLGMNTELWKIVVPLRTIADFFAALISIMSIPKLSGCMSSIKLILLMCVKYLALAPLPQILLSEMFILKTLGGYTFWNLTLFCLYVPRLVLIFHACEQLKGLVSDRTLVRFNAPVYLFLYLIISHVIGASWYYLSIKRQLSCWNGACKINTGCIFHCDGTTSSTLNSTLVNEFCPLNSQKFGMYLDALQSGIVEDKGVLKKFLQCVYWGIRHLSSFASNLYTSTNDGETFFAIIISIVGLILLVYILQNIRVGLSESRSANSATEGVGSSNQTGEGSSVQRTEGNKLV